MPKTTIKYTPSDISGSEEVKSGDNTIRTKDDNMGMRDIVNKDDSKAEGEPEASDRYELVWIQIHILRTLSTH